MSGSAHNSWANVSQLSPGATLARVQAERWASDSATSVVRGVTERVIPPVANYESAKKVKVELIKTRLAAAKKPRKK